MLVKNAVKITGGLSNPGKMPGFAYNLPAAECKIGSLLRTVKKSVCFGCYALKGRYAFPVVVAAMYRRLKSIMGPLWVNAMAVLINSKAKWGHDCFRWHDSGDIQNRAHLDRIIEVCRLTPGVMHWLPTRELKLMRDYIGSAQSWREIFPANVVPRLSAPMVDGPPPEIADFPTSTVISDHKPGPGICPAPEQDKTCGACRNCWNPNISNVAYRAH
jgi:hypothetical protein